MQRQSANPALTPYLRVFFGIVGLVVIFGSGLFLFPDIIRPRWPWSIAPFNSAFLGGIYLTELVIVVTLLATNRWSPARLILPMSLAFTGVVSIVTLFYLDRLLYDKVSTPAWFVAYFGSMFITAYFIWLYRKLPPVEGWPLTAFGRNYLLIQGLVLVVYGLAMILFPGPTTDFWPWKIDSFHAQVYSAVFISGGLGSLILSRSAARLELLALGLTQVALGVFSISGLLIVDASQKRVDWAGFGTWLWLAGFIMLFGAGAVMVWVARSDRVITAQPSVQVQ